MILNWLDSWKKFFLLFMLAISCSAGYIIWENRRELTYIALSGLSSPQIDISKITPEMNSLMADTGAVGAVIWSVHLENNYRKIIYININNEVQPSLTGKGEVILRPDTWQTIELIKLLNNRATCFPFSGASSVHIINAKANVKWVCAVAIPPSYGTFIGVLAVGFKQRPVNEDYIILRIRHSAERVIR